MNSSEIMSQIRAAEEKIQVLKGALIDMYSADKRLTEAGNSIKQAKSTAHPWRGQQKETFSYQAIQIDDIITANIRTNNDNIFATMTRIKQLESEIESLRNSLASALQAEASVK
ncbi:DUF5082 family protein [Xylocopilactobacillus apicola]|uniref:DUF5082 domain-containing protein n=1 Tax=Xylocopilactobacillus apicola TaxID=2932184 RepID=A0AAU9D3S5_9LACO|nr:DUF5082 family protein [Xylocopilactobacillus apicola]BDR59481.1 hypothetical protein XA3_19220 [Xylocopilactobacillus apicola]